MSLVCGLFSGAHFGRAILTAFIFCVVFGGIGFGIQILFEKFLDVGSSSGASEFGAPISEPSSKKGQTVDIVIQDEDLPSDENSGQYIVGSNRSLLNSSDTGIVKSAPSPTQPKQMTPVSGAGSAAETIKNENKAAALNAANVSEVLDDVTSSGESASDKQFVPVRNLETLYNVSGKEAVKKDESEKLGAQEIKQSEKNSDEQSFSAEDEQLDILPDLGEMPSFDDGNMTATHLNDADVNNESDFAAGGGRKVQEPEIKDAELMAKAISTILTNEE